MSQLMQGRLENYSRTRLDHRGAITDTEQGALGTVALAASLAGMAGQAASAASADAGEPADFVEFTLNGEKISGWLWFSPFNEGDDVTAVVQQQEGGLRVLALLRPRDRLIALYPHCSRGRLAHWKAVCRGTLKWGSVLMLVMLGLIGLVLALIDSAQWGREMLAYVQIMLIAIAPLLLVFALGMGWKWMKFVRMAEDIFSTLGWPDVRRIDLVARSKAIPLDSRVSYLVKDPRRPDPGLLALMNKEEAREYIAGNGTTDSQLMEALYGYGYFRY